MGRVKSQVLFTYESIKCPCYELVKYGKSGCCNDEHEILKIDDDHAASTIVSVAPIPFIEIERVFVFVEEKQTTDFNPSEHPLPPPKVPLFTKHCSLVFYDDEMIA